nr:hypothetical protein [Tanacetum cinerariifolium]
MTLKAEVPNLIIKPLNRIFNALNKMKSQRFVHLQKELSKAIHSKVGRSVQMNVKKEIRAVKVPRDIMVINAKELETKIVKNASDILQLVDLSRELEEQVVNDSTKTKMAAPVRGNMNHLKKLFKHQMNWPPVIFKNISYDQFTANLFSSGSSEYSLTPLPKVDDKGKVIASEDDQIKQIMPLVDQGGSTLSLLNLNQFRATGEGQMTIEEAKA